MKLSTFNAVCDLISANVLFVRAARILTAIHADPNISPTQLSTVAKVTSAAITGLMDRLDREGYIAGQHSSADRRKITAVLTAKGTAYVETILRAEEPK